MLAPFTPPPPYSMAGMIKLKEVAANMTPAAKPNMVSNSRWDIFFEKNIGIAPNPVAHPAATLARKPTSIIGYCCKNPIKIKAPS